MRVELIADRVLVDGIDVIKHIAEVEKAANDLQVKMQEIKIRVKLLKTLKLDIKTTSLVNAIEEIVEREEIK
ncbi:MAG: hypothetical protein MST00_03490 [Tenericutes bacterium]|nr:hypothetical protein [Mycoplasmatota bacterium]